MILKITTFRKSFRCTIIPVFLLCLIIGSCDSSTGVESPTAPTGNSQAIPIYNKAYSENFDADNIDDTILEAKNSYVLIDPFVLGIAKKNPAIKARNNQLGG